MKIKNGTLLQAQIAQESNLTFPRITQDVQLGSYRVFIPVAEDEDGPQIIAPFYVTRQCDHDVMGIYNVVYVPGRDYDANDENYRDQSSLRSCAIIANALYKAKYAYEMKEARDKAEREAKKMGAEIDRDALEATLKKITIDYEGDKDSKDPDAKYPKKQKIVGSLSITPFTIAMRVRVNGEGLPQWDDAQPVVIPKLGKQKTAALAQALREGKYVVGSHWLEASYDLTGTSVDEAKKHANLNPVDKRTSFINDPEIWDSDDRRNAFKRIREVPDFTSMTDDEAYKAYDEYIAYVRAKNYGARPTVTTDEATRKFHLGVSSDSFTEIRRSIDLSNDVVKKNAKLFLESDIFAKDKELTEALTKLVEESGDTVESEEQDKDDANESNILAATKAIASEHSNSPLAPENNLETIMKAATENNVNIPDDEDDFLSTLS